MIWPDFFPESCPPNDSKPAAGLFYRVIPDSKKRALKARDFYSHKRKQPNRSWPPDRCPCSLCGVSVMQSIEDSIKFANILLTIPAYQNKICFIAKGEIAPNMGLIKHTPDIENGLASHHDWWVPDECDPITTFEFCNESIALPSAINTETQSETDVS